MKLTEQEQELWEQYRELRLGIYRSRYTDAGTARTLSANLAGVFMYLARVNGYSRTIVQRLVRCIAMEHIATDLGGACEEETTGGIERPDSGLRN